MKGQYWIQRGDFTYHLQTGLLLNVTLYTTVLPPLELMSTYL